MKHLALAPALALALSGCLAAPEPQHQTLQSTSADLVHVIDGDTIIVDINGTEEHIRIIGIDAPEEGDCGAKEATDALTLLLRGAELSLLQSSVGDDRDKYGRLLRYIYADEEDVGRKLLIGGYVENFPWFDHEKKGEYSGLEQFNAC